MDSDVEIIKPIDEFMVHSVFLVLNLLFSFQRFTVFIKIKQLIITLLDYYDNKHFLDKDGVILN
jgi:cell shape-determining protein MreC